MFRQYTNYFIFAAEQRALFILTDLRNQNIVFYPSALPQQLLKITYLNLTNSVTATSKIIQNELHLESEFTLSTVINATWNK